MVDAFHHRQGFSHAADNAFATIASSLIVISFRIVCLFDIGFHLSMQKPKSDESSWSFRWCFPIISFWWAVAIWELYGAFMKGTWASLTAFIEPRIVSTPSITSASVLQGNNLLVAAEIYLGKPHYYFAGLHAFHYIADIRRICRASSPLLSTRVSLKRYRSSFSTPLSRKIYSLFALSGAIHTMMTFVFLFLLAL